MLGLLGFAATACYDIPTPNTNPATGVPVVGKAVDGGTPVPVTITIPLTQSTAPQPSGGAPAVGGAGGAGGITGAVGGTKATGGAGTTGGTTSTTVSQQPGSAFCGDGLRNSAKEECDDGPAVMADTGDFCSNLCQVTDTRVVVDTVADTPRATIARWLGAGRHPVAAGSNGFAVALMQEGPAVGALAIRVVRFDALGHRGGIINASADTLIERDADPVLAIAPNSDMIVAYTDFDGDGDAKGIAVRLIRAGKTTPEKAVYPAQNYFGSQYAPDILALSDRVIVAWTDESSADTGPDIRYRELSFDLKPLGDEKTLSATAHPEGRVSLSALGASWGAAWRAGNGDGWETTEVFDAGQNLRWSVSAHLPAEADDVPALLPVDGTHHALVYTQGTDFDAGDVYVDELYVAPLDTQAPGAVDAVPVPVTSAYSGWAGLSRRRPAIVRTQSEAWIAWWSGAPLGSAGGEDVWLE
jgi:cysteine-rich repeat protein